MTGTKAWGTEVLIVGAGPAGLVLANVLADNGVRFRIVDKKPGPVRESRAALVHVRTLELLDRLGLAHTAIDRGVPITRVEVYQRGRSAAEFPLAGKGIEALTPFPHALALEQDRTEQLLVEGLREHDIGVGWETELVALADDREPQAVLRGPDGVEEAVSARWVVGADGASSRVRHAVGLSFSGKTYGQTGLLADVTMDVPDGARLGEDAIRLHLTRGGFAGILALNDGRYRLFGAVPGHLTVPSTVEAVSHEAYASVELAELQRWLDEYFFIDATLTSAAWTSLFRIHSRIAHSFRSGSVFLIGDAAHIHSPAGGQGMNLGIGDAFNLSWKLALVAKGHACCRLLDSYDTERHAVAQTVLRYSDRGFALEATSSRLAQWIKAHVGTRLVGPLMRLGVVRRLIFRLFSQTWISYRASPVVSGRHWRGGPRPGDRAPHLSSESTSDSAFELTSTTHTLLLFEGGTPSPSSKQRAVEGILERYPVPVSIRVVSAAERRLHELYGAKDAHLVLIRPDGHVAYAAPAGDLDGLATYMDGFYARRENSER